MTTYGQLYEGILQRAARIAADPKRRGEVLRALRVVANGPAPDEPVDWLDDVLRESEAPRRPFNPGPRPTF